MRNFTPDEIERRVARAAKMLRIEHLLERKTRQALRRRDAAGVDRPRHRARDPTVFLMDEPLSNLNAKLRELLRSELKDLQATLGATFLFVTHDQIEAMSMGNKVGVLWTRGGWCRCRDAERDLQRAARHLRRDLRRLAGDEPAARGGRGRPAVVPGAFEVPLRPEGRARLRRDGGPLTVGVRSEDVRLGAGGDASAQVHHVENHGVELVVTLRAGETLFKATVPAVTRLRIDETIPFALNQERLHGFDAATGVNLAL